MLKMFNKIDIGERAGGGIPNIFHVWREHGWVMPDITEQLDPERTILELAFKKIGDKCKNERNHYRLSYSSCRGKIIFDCGIC